MITTLTIQTCDGCGKRRELEPGASGDQGGWREVKHTKHLCPHCIDKALNQQK